MATVPTANCTRPSLNESPSEKEGKFSKLRNLVAKHSASMKVPPKRKGNYFPLRHVCSCENASMKVPPKRKGNLGVWLGNPI